MLQKIFSFIIKPGFLLTLYAALAIIAGIQLVSLGSHNFGMPGANPNGNIMYRQETLNMFIGKKVTDYNNYKIFKYSFFHLLAGKNLYGIFPDDHWDLFKYSPTFALFMGSLAYLPDMAGLCLWNLLNALALFGAIRMLPFSERSKGWLTLFAGLELLTSLQNAQSNGLLCGLLIAAFACLERKKTVWGTLWLVLATLIKVYGAAGFLLFLFYPQKGKFVLWSFFWSILLIALPLTVTSFHTLAWQYHNWADMMAADASTSWGVSVNGWLHSWFRVDNAKMMVTVIGFVLFLAPLARYKMYSNQVYRLLMLASMLIWVIIFNHKAESPTYVIAVAGAGIWYFSMPHTVWRTIMLWTTFVFTSLATTDLFPPLVRQQFLVPYTIKALPCIIVWCALLRDMLLLRKNAVLPESATDHSESAAETLQARTL